MSDQPINQGPHDMGGAPAGPIDTTDHGMTHSVYFFDPDGNRLEIFCDMMPAEAKQWLHEHGGVAKPLVLEEAR